MSTSCRPSFVKIHKAVLEKKLKMSIVDGRTGGRQIIRVFTQIRCTKQLNHVDKNNARILLPLSFQPQLLYNHVLMSCWVFDFSVPLDCGNTLLYIYHNVYSSGLGNSINNFLYFFLRAFQEVTHIKISNKLFSVII